MRRQHTDDKVRLTVTVSRTLHTRLTGLARECGLRSPSAAASVILHALGQLRAAPDLEDTQPPTLEVEITDMFATLAHDRAEGRWHANNRS